VAGDPARPEELAGSHGFDPSKPNAARVYDFLLGGKDNFAADREAAARLIEALPDAARAAKANRAFLAAAVRYVASRGIDQYVDVGAGLPTSPNVHECARHAVPGARVAYVDHDPLVVTHARALLATDRRVTVVNGDVRTPETILSARELTALIDLTRPVCVLFVSMLHFMAADQADAAVAAFRERMAPGSYLVISAGHANERNIPVQDQVQAAYGSDAVLTGRTTAEFAALFGDFELVPPGIVPIAEWPAELTDKPQSPTLRLVPSAPISAEMLAAIGRKAA
jgi:O-methyltransferase involved in polyketide biosynthesis